VLQPISEIESWLVSWLYPGRLALAKQSILDGDPDVPDLEQWLAPLRERYPPLTPLDEL
jgi:hypothetical protein